MSLSAWKRKPTTWTTRPATVAVNPPLPKVIVSPSSHTLPTPIKRDVLASYLLHYDEHESTILIAGFSLGFSLHYDGPAYSRTSGNHRSALQAASIVDRKLLHEVSLGRIAGPFTHPPFNDFQSSPLGLVPKHDASSTIYHFHAVTPSMFIHLSSSYVFSMKL